MLRKVLGGLVVMLFLVGVALADDKKSDSPKPDPAKQAKPKANRVIGSVVKVDADKNQITVKTQDGEKTFDVNEDTKFMSAPRTTAVKLDLKDKRLAKGTAVGLVMSDDGKTVKEVRLVTRRPGAVSPAGAPKVNPDK